MTDGETEGPTGPPPEGGGARSEAPCPVCGAHRLAMLSFPEIPGAQPSVTGEAPLGGRGTDPSPPAIGCLACGAEWRDLDAFRAAAGDAG